MLSYSASGDSAQVMLLIHGLLGDQYLWSDAGPLFNKPAGSWYWKKKHQPTRFKTIVVDLPGVGESPYPKKVTDLYAISDQLVEVLDAEGVDKAVWVGHSLGGYVTTAGLRDHADRMSHAVLAYSTPLPDSPEKAASRNTNIAVIDHEGPAAFADIAAPGFFLPNDPPAIVQRYREHADRWPADTMRRMIAALRDRDDTTELLAAARLPILTVQGRDDDKVPYLDADVRIGTTIVTDTGHVGVATHPHTFAGVVLGWLDDLDFAALHI